PDAAQRRWSESAGLPGSGFLWPAGPTTFHARFHTPGKEVGLSGHTALACAHAALTGPLVGAPGVTLRSRTDDLPITREAGALWITLPRPRLEPYDAPRARIARALGMSPDGFLAATDVARTQDGDLLIPIASLVELNALTPDREALAALGRELGTRGFCLFTSRTTDPASTVQSRFLAPHIGLDEDVATGSVHGPLAARLWGLGWLRADGPVLYVVGEQGAALGRPCRVRVELTIDDGAIARTRVGGEVITIEERVLANGELA
ncbi:MAG: PhzF family phenazine biosynthesis isomerase, partial [Candidatus Eisenbacteria bacterium]